MAYTDQSIVEYGLQETGVLLNAAFAEYTVPINFDDEGFARLLVSAHVDVTASRVLLEDGAGDWRGADCAGADFAAGWRRWRSCRRRGQGAGSWFLRELCAAARESGTAQYGAGGDQQQSCRVALYHGAGFQFMRRLLSFQRPGRLGRAGRRRCAGD
jgi:hypothetical protein